MKPTTMGSVMGVVLAAACGLAAADYTIGSSFNKDTEGWGTLNDVQNFQWDGGIGNPAGAIRGQDIGSGNVWYFTASTLYHGDLSGAYGNTLSWELLGIVGNHTTIPDQADVMLTGAGITIGIDADVQPLNGQWTPWEVVIAPGAWRTVTNTSNGALGTPVDEAQIRAVLADVIGLYIRGEYTNTAGDRMALDNVSLIVGGLCPADLAAPYGVINVFDLFAYLDAYNAADPIADIAEPFGVFNLFDVFEYLDLYNTGCFP